MSVVTLSDASELKINKGNNSRIHLELRKSRALYSRVHGMGRFMNAYIDIARFKVCVPTQTFA